MPDKSWMLNPKAIRHANRCIHIIRKTTGLRLKLSQPDFLHTLHKSVEDIESNELGLEYSQLLSVAGVGNILNSLSQPAKAVVAQPMAAGAEHFQAAEETVEVEGEVYPKYRNGRQFSGLIFGIPRYR